MFFLSRSESERTEMAIQTDVLSADTTRSLGRTTLLRDTVIRGEESEWRRESPKTAMLLALSRPSRPISRSQSQVTVAGETGQFIITRLEQVTSINDCGVCVARDQTEEGEEAEGEGPGGEEHPAALQDLRQPAVQGRAQEGHLQGTLQVPVHRQSQKR